MRGAFISILVAAWCSVGVARAEQVRVPAGRGVIEIEARQQRYEGNVYYAEGQVEVRYQGFVLRTERLEFNATSGEAVARGKVEFEADNQRLEAEEARYNIRTGRGFFRQVRGQIHVVHAANRDVLRSPNPFSFEAREVERVDARTYRLRQAWVTVCEPEKPLWRFHTASATIRVERNARLRHASFRLLDIPVLYLPYATAPVGRKLRQSGFLVPHGANTSNKGMVVGTAYYWAPTEWMDLTLGGEYLSKRGFSHAAELRAVPREGVTVNAGYFAVNDRGLVGPGGTRLKQGGHQANVSLDGYLPGGWRAVLDFHKLTSLKFRLAFAETFERAVNSEVRSTLFLTNNARGFSVNFSGSNYKNFLSAEPETAVVLRAAPGARVSSVDQAPFRRWPLYFGFHVAAEALHRSEPGFSTPDAVQRFEVAPRVTLPLRWGPWLGITPTFVARTTRYGAQVQSGALAPRPLVRNTQEVTVDVWPPALARIFTGRSARWKHVIEPQLIYRYVRGVNDFGRFLRFDENDILTDTNEIEYGITQRLLRRKGDGEADEVLSWRVAQKRYFDPMFNGALVPGERNVFRATALFSPFAFADGPRTYSPVVSDLRVTPGGRFDAQFRLDIDPQRRKITAAGTLVKMRPYRESFVTLAHFATRNAAVLQPRSHQVSALAGYGQTTRPGLNAAFGFSYDVQRKFLQSQLVQVSFNGRCCGIGFEYRRLALGPVRSENQFRVALMIANVGTFGNLRRQEKLFE
jgi:LPS-assembly protein